MTPVRVRIADGSHKLRFEVVVQGFVFSLTAQVMPMFSLIKALLGTGDLKHLGAKLDFTTKNLVDNLFHSNS